jgi:hypothetical protein
MITPEDGEQGGGKHPAEGAKTVCAPEMGASSGCMLSSTSASGEGAELDESEDESPGSNESSMAVDGWWIVWQKIRTVGDDVRTGTRRPDRFPRSIRQDREFFFVEGDSARLPRGTPGRVRANT